MTKSVSACVHAVVFVTALGATAPQGHATELPTAMQHFVAGKRLYEAHLYRRALAEFEAGFVASELPGFLINMAQCHRQLGELDEAVRDYKRYLDDDSTSSAAREVQEIVAELEGTLEPPAPPAPPPPSLTLIAQPPPAVERRATRPFTWAGVALSGALLVTGAGLEIATGQRFDELRGSCGTTINGCTPAERSSFDHEYQAATGVLVAAAITSVATIAAAALEERARRAHARQGVP